MQLKICGTDLTQKNSSKVLVEYFRHTHHPKYDDESSILTNVSLDQLITVINRKVPANNWPTAKFNNKDCTVGLSKFL